MNTKLLPIVAVTDVVPPLLIILCLLTHTIPPRLLYTQCQSPSNFAFVSLHGRSLKVPIFHHNKNPYPSVILFVYSGLRSHGIEEGLFEYRFSLKSSTDVGQ